MSQDNNWAHNIYLHLCMYVSRYLVDEGDEGSCGLEDANCPQCALQDHASAQLLTSTPSAD